MRKKKKAGGRIDDPNDNFEINSKIIVPEFYDEFLKYNNELEDLTKTLKNADVETVFNDKNLRLKIYTITRRVINLFSRVASSFDLFEGGIRFNHMQWDHFGVSDDHIDDLNIGTWKLKSYRKLMKGIKDDEPIPLSMNINDIADKEGSSWLQKGLAQRTFTQGSTTTLGPADVLSNNYILEKITDQILGLCAIGYCYFMYINRKVEKREAVHYYDIGSYELNTYNSFVDKIVEDNVFDYLFYILYYYFYIV